MKFTPKY